MLKRVLWLILIALCCAPALAWVQRGVAVTSTPITGLSFGAPFRYNSGYNTKYVQSDTWANDWCDDDNIYTLNDDSLNWQAVSPTSNMQTSLLSTFTNAMSGSNVNSMAAWGVATQTGSDSATWKANDIICVGGVMYGHISRQIYGNMGNGFIQTAMGAQLIKSTNHGTTWTPSTPSTAQPYASPMWPGTTFPAASFVHYGKNYTGNTVDNSNLYVYAISNNGCWNNCNYLIVGRVLISAIGSQSASDWTYYTGGDGMDSANWTSTASAAAHILTVPKSLGIMDYHYIPALNRYMMLEWLYPDVRDTGTQVTSSTTINVYDCAKPWAKCTLVQTIPSNPTGFYNPHVISKSLSIDNGITLNLIQAGDYNSITFPGNTYGPYILPVTVNPGAPSAGCAQATNYIAALPTTPSGTESAAFKTAICGIIQDNGGQWPPINGLYIFANASDANAKVNAANIGQYNLTEHGVCTFTVDQGITGSVANSCYEDTGFNTLSMSDGGASLTYASVGGCVLTSRTSVAANMSLLGVGDGTNFTYLNPMNDTVNRAAWELNGATSFPEASSATNVQGTWAVTRKTSTSQSTLYHNGTSVSTQTDNSSALPNGNLYILGFNNNGTANSFVSYQVAYAYFGGATDAQQASIRSRLNTMMLSLGNSNPAAC